jgi:hypothetical protein
MTLYHPEHMERPVVSVDVTSKGAPRCDAEHGKVRPRFMMLFREELIGITEGQYLPLYRLHLFNEPTNQICVKHGSPRCVIGCRPIRAAGEGICGRGGRQCDDMAIGQYHGIYLYWHDVIYTRLYLCTRLLVTIKLCAC